MQGHLCDTGVRLWYDGRIACAVVAHRAIVGDGMKLLRLYDRFEADIDRIERDLAHKVALAHPTLRDAALHLLRAGGKRVRPVFVLLCGQFGQYDVQRLVDAAVPLEMIHMATLVHDDVIDCAHTRRGQQTVGARWGAQTAMYVGDFLFGKAIAQLVELDVPAIHRIVSRVMVQMVIGELEQMRWLGVIDQTVRDYLLRIRRKTALLIASSCQIGALVAGASEQCAQQLYMYGYHIGMAFQIQDDLLDFTGTETQLGKRPGSDLRQGNVTLPVLYAAKDARVREVIARCLLPGADDSVKNDAIVLVQRSDGLGEAARLAQRYCARALRVLDRLPNIAARDDLRTTAEVLAHRAY